MASCYICGDDVPKGQGYRRKVHTGSSTGITSGGSFSARSYSGIRTVCGNCAAAVDRENANATRRVMIIIVLGVLGVMAAIAWISMYGRR